MMVIIKCYHIIHMTDTCSYEHILVQVFICQVRDEVMFDRDT